MTNGYKLGLAAIAASISLVGCGGGGSSDIASDIAIESSITDEDIAPDTTPSIYQIIASELYNKSISANGVTVMFSSDETGWDSGDGAFTWSINASYELILVYTDDRIETITFSSSPATDSTITVGSIPYTITSYDAANWSLALADYSYVFIYKNISADIANDLKTRWETYQDFYTLDIGAADSGDMSCTDLGFTTNKYYNENSVDTGYGAVTFALYHSDDFSKMCSEVDYGNFDYIGGSTDLALTYNFAY